MVSYTLDQFRLTRVIPGIFLFTRERFIYFDVVGVCMKEDLVSFSIVLNGAAYNLRFDLIALTGAFQAMKGLGLTTRNSTWQLGDTPYDIGEEIILIQHGINGARRLSKQKLLDFDEISQMVQSHFDWMAEKTEAFPEEADAEKFFQDEQKLVMSAISDAVKVGLGFRRTKGKRDE